MTRPGDAMTSGQQAIVAGVVFGLLRRYAADPDGSIIDEVEAHEDALGNYQPYFTVTLRSGHKVVVSVADSAV